MELLKELRNRLSHRCPRVRLKSSGNTTWLEISPRSRGSWVIAHDEIAARSVEGVCRYFVFEVTENLDSGCRVTVRVDLALPVDAVGILEKICITLLGTGV